MKSLQAKITTMLVLLLVVALVLVGLLVNDALQNRKRARRYEIINRIAGYLNAAAGWQAIERGVGATILGTDNPPVALTDKFRVLQENGDAQVALAFSEADIFLAGETNKEFSDKVNEWNLAYDDLQQARKRVGTKQI